MFAFTVGLPTKSHSSTSFQQEHFRFTIAHWLEDNERKLALLLPILASSLFTFPAALRQYIYAFLDLSISEYIEYKYQCSDF